VLAQETIFGMAFGTEDAFAAMDPDLDTHHLMNFSLILGPQQHENLAQLSTLGPLMLASKDFRQSRRELVGQSNALVNDMEKGMGASYALGTEASPEICQ